ncbi:MAG: DUF4139 domain-containing protein [Bacteroidales bacterium]|jgi:uncharacterized protein (TIGR02231 family)|nr:DUF4139 domain-containing protein [Bacteroidales bacterium]
MNTKFKVKILAGIAIFSFVSVSSFAQLQNNSKTSNVSKEITGKIEKITIFPHQALIEKEAKITLKTGNNEVILVGNSEFMIANSLQFQTDEQVMVTDFTPSLRYVQNKADESKFSQDTKRRIKLLRDSLDAINYQQTATKNLIAVMQTEQTALKNMKSISNSQSVDTVGKIKDAITYFHQKMTELNESIQRENRTLAKRQEQITAIQTELNLIIQDETEDNVMIRNQYIITMNIYSEKATEITLYYNYHVGNVVWQPIYDVKFSDPKVPAKFVLKAQVTQNTGEDWKDITLVFSTESLTGENLGTLYPYYLHSLQPIVLKQTRGVKEEESMDLYNAVSSAEKAVSTDASPINAVQAYTQLTQTETTMLGKEYTVGTKHTILSGERQKTIPLETKAKNATYKHFAIPKLSKTVFLSARIASWEELELMDAPCRIYLDNRYINNGYLTQNLTDDTLSIETGQDKRVTTDRKIVRTKPEKTNILSSMLENNVEVTLIVRNGNQYPVSLNLQDQIPLSQDKDIKVTAIDTALAEYDTKSGKLTWDLTIEAGQSKTIKFVYNVRYPKDTKLILN